MDSKLDKARTGALQGTLLDPVLSWARVDLAPDHRQPWAVMVVVATIASLVASLAADAALVAIGTALFPSTKGYVHFQFSNYAKLTIIGVVIACVAWPVVTRISLPDAWLFFRGSPPKAVAVLVVMHLAIAVITYNCLVHLAPVRRHRRARA